MNKISAEDKNVLSKILRETYALVDASNNKDTTDAINALFNVGIEEVDAIPDEIEDIRKSALLVNKKKNININFSIVFPFTKTDE